MADVNNLFKLFGFNESETKVYLALIQHGPATGYEVSNLSGVPRSKVYPVLKKMVFRGTLVVAQGEKTHLYSALPLEQLVTLISGVMEDSLAELETAVRKLEKPYNDDRIWSLKEYQSIMNKCCHLISRSKSKILIQIWTNELNQRIERCINEKQSALRDVLVILYDENRRYDTRLQRFYSHGFERDKMIDAGCRWITVVSDGEEMIHATIFSEQTAEAIYTKNKNMVFFATEYVLHDAYCLRLIDKVGAQVRDTFGEDMQGIRDVFSI